MSIPFTKLPQITILLNKLTYLGPILSVFPSAQFLVQNTTHNPTLHSVTMSPLSPSTWDGSSDFIFYNLDSFEEYWLVVL